MLLVGALLGVVGRFTAAACAFAGVVGRFVGRYATRQHDVPDPECRVHWLEADSLKNAEDEIVELDAY